MASADMFTLIIRGKGGHGAQPHLTIDAVVTADDDGAATRDAPPPPQPARMAASDAARVRRAFIETFMSGSSGR